MNLRTLPPSPRPTLVDSLSSLVTLLDTIKDPYYAAEIRQTWLEWGPIVLPVVPDIKQAGIDYHIVSPEEEPIACEPGSNRYSIFDDYKTPEYMNEILQAFAPDVAAPRQLSARNYIQSDFDLPFVFKDTESNRGENKFLIESETQARKLKRFLGRLVGGGYDVKDLLLEEYIETPGDQSTSYRYTMTPTGSIVAVTLLAAGNVGDHKIQSQDVTGVFRELASDESLYNLDSRSITSNTNAGRTDIGLDFNGRNLELKGLTGQQRTILETHGIDPLTRRAPESITRTAGKVANTLGPSVGLIVGIDLLQQASDAGVPYFVEINSLPSTRNINASLHPRAKQLSHDALNRLGLTMTIRDLAIAAKR